MQNYAENVILILIYLLTTVGLTPGGSCTAHNTWNKTVNYFGWINNFYWLHCEIFSLLGEQTAGIIAPLA